MVKLLNYFIVATLSLIGSLSVHAQSTSFSLEGVVDSMQSGVIQLWIDGVSTDKDALTKFSIKNGKFMIEGELPQVHPYLAFLWVNDIHTTPASFVISPGRQFITVDEKEFGKAFGKIPTVSSGISEEGRRLGEQLQSVDKNQTVPFYTQRNEIIKEIYHGNPPQKVLDSLDMALEQISLVKDNVIKNYITQHPSSYIGLLWLYDRISIIGFRPELNNAFFLLDKNIRNSDIGKKTGEALKNSKKTAVGQIFPSLKLLSIENKETEFVPDKQQSQLVFVDFWYSHCGPCIAQFDALKIFYEKYNEQGLKMVGISTDKKKDTGDWKNIISKYTLPWQQLLDIDGKNAAWLNINIFPSNFVLDEKGTILYKNVSMDRLKQILQTLKKDEL
jgi:peroxiredoxin